jgi:hypothetical protein
VSPPPGNLPDVLELKPELVEGLKIDYVDKYEQVFDLLFGDAAQKRSPRVKRPAKAKRPPATKHPAANRAAKKRDRKPAKAPLKKARSKGAKVSRHR